jgi:hypothetical protein
MQNCLAAKHNPANACTDNTCKWPNACGATHFTPIAPESAIVSVDEAAEITEPKKKPGRPKKGE